MFFEALEKAGNGMRFRIQNPKMLVFSVINQNIKKILNYFKFSIYFLIFSKEISNDSQMNLSKVSTLSFVHIYSPNKFVMPVKKT